MLRGAALKTAPQIFAGISNGDAVHGGHSNTALPKDSCNLDVGHSPVLSVHFFTALILNVAAGGELTLNPPKMQSQGTPPGDRIEYFAQQLIIGLTLGLDPWTSGKVPKVVTNEEYQPKVNISAHRTYSLLWEDYSRNAYTLL